MIHAVILDDDRTKFNNVRVHHGQNEYAPLKTIGCVTQATLTGYETQVTTNFSFTFVSHVLSLIHSNPEYKI